MAAGVQSVHACVSVGISVLALALALASVQVHAIANDGGPSRADMARAYLKKPLPSSHVVGADPRSIFAAMNRHLERQPHHTQACEGFTHAQLNELARELWRFRSPRLAALYEDAGDKRRIHFRDDGRDDGLSYKEKLWAEENLLAATDPDTFGAGSQHYTMVRDGKCAELVMWWIHHLSQENRGMLAARPGFRVPLLPAHGLPHMEGAIAAPPSVHTREYIYQVTCSDCHSTGLNITAPTSAGGPPADTPDRSLGGARPGLRPKQAVAGDVPPGTCPISPKTQLPSVWYEPMSDVGNRRKRCDWDYDPPCQLCEGIGGYSWGDQEDDITYIDCKPVALPKDIPAGNVTTPVWPKAFVVNEVTVLINQLSEGGQFPGADPCAVHNFNNDTEVFYYDDSRVNFRGPIMYTNTTKTDIYTLPTADMFIKIDHAFCICVTPFQNGNHSVVPTGPLLHDFAKDAVLVGREMIGLEGLDMSVEADHWNKGPHHFWVGVASNKFVRGWQPWNGLNIYDPITWRVGPVAKELFQVPRSCYGKGLLHKNISCRAPYPYP